GDSRRRHRLGAQQGRRRRGGAVRVGERGGVAFQIIASLRSARPGVERRLRLTCARRGEETMAETYPDDLRYTSDHEWVKDTGGGTVRVGITQYAQEALGDVVYVSLPEVGETVDAGDGCGEVESTKSVSDLYAPLPGTITAVNDALDASPELVNSDPYGQDRKSVV